MLKCLKFSFGRDRKKESGMTLIEILVALTILAIVAVAFLSGAATALKVVAISQERVTAESLAKSQMESIKSQDYDSEAPSYGYAEITNIPEGYDIDIQVEEITDGLQRVTVAITRGEKQLLGVTDYKVDR